MTKSDAILSFGSISQAAREIGITPSAISQWPEELPQRLVDRVQAALYRRQREAEQMFSAPKRIKRA